MQKGTVPLVLFSSNEAVHGRDELLSPTEFSSLSTWLLSKNEVVTQQRGLRVTLPAMGEQ